MQIVLFFLGVIALAVLLSILAMKMSNLQLTIGIVVLVAISIFLSIKIYQVVMDPIRFERIKMNRFCAVTERLEQIRDAQLAYRSEYGEFSPDLESLIAYIDTGSITIIERKDSSFMAFNKIYQTMMNKDTVIVRVLGKQPAIEKFGEGFDPNVLRVVPFNKAASFSMDAGKIERSGVKIPVFEVSIAENELFPDLNDRYNQYIKKDKFYSIGSLSEPNLSGNYENTKCKD